MREVVFMHLVQKSDLLLVNEDSKMREADREQRAEEVRNWTRRAR